MYPDYMWKMIDAHTKDDVERANAAEKQLQQVKRWAATPFATHDELLKILAQEPALSLELPDTPQGGW